MAFVFPGHLSGSRGSSYYIAHERIHFKSSGFDTYAVQLGQYYVAEGPRDLLPMEAEGNPINPINGRGTPFTSHGDGRTPVHLNVAIRHKGTHSWV